MRILIALSCVLSIPLISNAAIWTAHNTWNEDWEQKYSDWIENELPLEVFTRGKWAGTVADCTDTTYILRIIFSYENKLPFAAYGSSNELMTNEAKAFDTSPSEIARVKKFLQLVSKSTSSLTVHKSTYPVKISRETLRPGVIEVQRPFPGQGGSGHAQVIRTLKDNGAIGFIWNSVPPAVRMLSLNFKLTYVPRLDTPIAGFRRWIWPQDLGRPKQHLPGYSEEQYSLGLVRSGPEAGQYSLEQYAREVERRLKIRDIPKEELFEQYVPTICSYVVLRDEVIKKGEAVRQRLGGRCMTAQEYDDYSTPSRDSRLIATWNDFYWQFAVKVNEEKNIWEAKDVEAAVNVACPLNGLDPRHTMSTFDFLGHLAYGNASSNPNDDMWVRWGYSGQKETRCPKY